MLAVGSNDPNTSAGGKVQIHEYNEASRSVYFVTENEIKVPHIVQYCCTINSCVYFVENWKCFFFPWFLESGTE